MKRAAIYFFYDQDGVVDAYNEFLLKDALHHVEYLLIVINGTVSDAGLAIMEGLANEVLVRENVGLDVYAYRHALAHMGWEAVGGYDEVVLFNSTIFGPVHSFQKTFDAMERLNVDFWGITKHYREDDVYGKCKYGYIPEHIQSYFIAVRQRLLRDPSFRDYWLNMPQVRNYSDSVCLHEAVFTKHFNDLGFASEAYVDTDDLKEFSVYPLMDYPMKLVKDRKCPIFKRKTFTADYDQWLNKSCGDEGVRLMEYLKETGKYPVDHVWENVLRTANMYDVKERLHLTYILKGDGGSLQVPRACPSKSNSIRRFSS